MGDYGNTDKPYIVCETSQELGQRAASDGARLIREVLAARGEATIIVATGTSQLETLAALVAQPDIEWSRVTGFHLDEYIDLPMTHAASFRGYLQERFVSKVPLATFHYIDGETDSEAECMRVGGLIRDRKVDVAFIGIGENGHLAFNDPPADFQTTEPFIIVKLDEACRRQQLDEGWFKTFDDVPTHAISMSIQQIFAAGHIICSVPDRRKAEAVYNAIEKPITPDVPASILQQHENAMIYLDPESASLLAL